MKLINIPTKFNIPFASLAGAGFIRPVPQVPTGTPGQASLQVGFPPENFSPVAAGGVPPFGQDFNGLLNQSTAWDRWQATGRAFPPYDPTFQTAIAGYPEGSIVESLVESFLFYGSLVDDNVTNPDTGGAGWFIWSRKLTSNTDLYVNTSTGSDANNGLSPGTAKKTIQAAVSTAWSFPPSQFTITIHIADGVYNEAISTPLAPGPAVVITGNAATPSNVQVNASGGATFFAQGPNAVTVQNLAVTNSNANAAAFEASNGATLTTLNTVSGSVAGWVFLANGSGTVVVGTHAFTANFGYGFAAYRNGNLVLTGGSTFTVSAGITITDFAIAVSLGSIEVPGTGAPTFAGSTPTGGRYSAIINGVINTQGAGVNYFPGTVAGTTSSGGQYA